MLTLKEISSLLAPQYIILVAIGLFSSLAIHAGIFPIGSKLVLTLFALIFTISGFNFLNMVEDETLDKINKPNRPIPNKKVDKKVILFLAIAFYIISLSLAYFVSANIFFTIILLAILTIAYTARPFYLKRKIFATPIFGAMFYSIIPFICGFLISNNPFSIIFFVFFSLLIGIIAPIKDIEDQQGEKKFGFKTIPLLIGEKSTLKWIMNSVYLLFVGLTVAIIFSNLNKLFLLPVILSLMLFWALNKKVKIINSNENLIIHSKNVSTYIWYVLLVEIGITITAFYITGVS
ncbi:MAG: UbiA family prenyltransferase [Candidatus Diapherotrites archaeon]|nr:UbiA family prenyltransferase [Candidatus Diapherotrites archaeon]